MKLTQILNSITSLISLAVAQSNLPGYFTNFSTLPNNNTFSFGKNYAVLNLDLITDVVGAVANFSAGQEFISCVSTWTNTVHALNPPPLTIWTRVYFASYRYPEVKQGTPFAAMLQAGGFDGPNSNSTNSLIESSPLTQIYSGFVVNQTTDIVIHKTRYYAGYGSDLEIILSSQNIDTVIISGARTSGVVLYTASNLYERNYNVFVISNNSIELPPLGAEIDQAIKEGIIPKLPAQVITLEQALAALNRSGPAVY